MFNNPYKNECPEPSFAKIASIAPGNHCKALKTARVWFFFIGTERWNPTSAKWHSAHIHSSDSKPGRRELVDPTLPFVPCPVSEQLSDSGCCAMTPRKHSSTHSLDVSRLWLDPRWFPDAFQMISDSSISMDHKYPENVHMKHDQRPIKSPWKITPCHYVCCLNPYVFPPFSPSLSHHFPYICQCFPICSHHVPHHIPNNFPIIFPSCSPLLSLSLWRGILANLWKP